MGLDKDALNNCYERALVTMHKMPRIWSEYIESLISQGFVTRTRRTLDRALAALPVTQHDRIWVLYLRFITQPGIPMDTAFRVYRRYLKYVLFCFAQFPLLGLWAYEHTSMMSCMPLAILIRVSVSANSPFTSFHWLSLKSIAVTRSCTAFRVTPCPSLPTHPASRMEPGHREEYIAYLLKHERWGEAAAELAVCVNDDTFRSLEGKSKHTLWLELCDIITKHPEDVRHLNIDAIIRGGIRKFTNEVPLSPSAPLSYPSSKASAICLPIHQRMDACSGRAGDHVAQVSTHSPLPSFAAWLATSVVVTVPPPGAC